MQLQPAMFPFVRLHLPSHPEINSPRPVSLYKVVAFLALQLVEHSQQNPTTPCDPLAHERVTVEIITGRRIAITRATVMKLTDLAGFKVNTRVGLA
jgi:hypothetical protein